MPDAAPVDPSVERTRRKFARRQWRRRWLVWRYVAAAALVVALAVGVVWALWFSSWLSVQGVDVAGVETISEAEVRDAAGVEEGEPLATADLGAIEARVEALAAVRSADVSRRWPDRVLVRVEERVPVAVVEIAGSVRGMDATGVLFREYDRVPGDLPLIEAGSGASGESLEEGAKVIAALPADLAARVRRLEVETIDAIRLVLRDDRVVVWGSAAESDQKAAVLEGLLRQDAGVYDVSVPGRPVTSRD